MAIWLGASIALGVFAGQKLLKKLPRKSGGTPHLHDEFKVRLCSYFYEKTPAQLAVLDEILHTNLLSLDGLKENLLSKNDKLPFITALQYVRTCKPNRQKTAQTAEDLYRFATTDGTLTKTKKELLVQIFNALSQPHAPLDAALLLLKFKEKFKVKDE